MPTYEYLCRSCGHTFEIVQSMNDASLTICPVCGGELRKVFGAPAISFKGSGFYATDHGKKAKKPKSSEAAPEKSSETASSGSDKKSDASPGTTGSSKKDAPKPAPTKPSSAGGNGTSSS